MKSLFMFLEDYSFVLHSNQKFIRTEKPSMTRVNCCFFGTLMLAILMGWQPAEAHDQIPGPPQTKPIAIVDVMIHPVSSPVIEGGTILFERGKITALGKMVELPEGTVEIQGDELHVYPGLIDSFTDLGLREIGAVDVTLDSQETGSQNPNVRSWVAVNPDSELIPVARANGIMSAMVVPRGSGIRGQSAVMALDGWTASDMLLRAGAGLVVDWESIEPRFSEGRERVSQRERALKQLDDLLDAARRYADARVADPVHTPSNVRLESLLPVLAGERPLIAEADRQEAIESAVLYAQSRGLKLVIAGGYDAERCASLLTKFDVPVIITMTYRLPRYRHDPYDASYTLPARLHAAGVRFAICGDTNDSSNARNLPYHAANAMAYGLDAEVALSAVTLSAAEILGVSEAIGSLDVDKLATLVVTTGDILEGDTQIVDAYIAGRRVDLGSRHTMLYEKYKQKYEQRKLEANP